MTDTLDTTGAGTRGDAPAGTGTSTATGTRTAGAPPPPYPRRWLALFVVLAAEVLDLLDSTIVNVAAPSVRADLGGGYTFVQWIAAGYTLAFAIGLVTGGRLGDIHGRRRMFLVGAAGFTLASVLCGLAPDPATLIAFRVAQGLFGAVLIPQGLGVIRAVFPAEEMPKAFGLFGPVMGLAAVCGPVVAGALIDADVAGTGWRMVFLINLPLGLAAVVGALVALPESRSPEPTRLDPLGMVLVTAALLLVVYPLVQGRDAGWPAWTFASMAAAVPLFAAFAWYERWRERGGRSPLVVPSLFRRREFPAGLAVGLTFFAATGGLMLVFAVYLQAGLGYSPLRAGLTMSPMALGIAGGAAAGAALGARFGRPVLQCGALAVALGVVALYVTLRLAGTGVGPWQLAPALLATGVGVGAALTPFFGIVLAGVDDAEAGSASGTITAVQQLGGAVGVAVVGTVFFGLLAPQVGGAAGAAAPALTRGLAAAGVPAADGPALVAALRRCAADRAVARDPAAVPVSCRDADRATGRAARDAQRPERVAPLVVAAARDAGRSGFTAAMRRVLWIEVAMMAGVAGLAFAMPRRARQPAEPDVP